METLLRTSVQEQNVDPVIDVKVEVEEEEDDDEEEELDEYNKQTSLVQEDSEEVVEPENEEPNLTKNRAWEPNVYCTLAKERYYFAGYDIDVRESLDSYGALIWPGAVALCQYLDAHHQEINLMDKAVLEIGAGTGLLSIVSTLLGAWVTATDVPDLIGNLRYNLARSTRGRCRYTPQVGVLCWEQDLEKTYPRSVYRYDYVLAADVVYHHNYLDDLLATMRHFCQPGTTLIWSNKVRLQSDLCFTERFHNAFHTTLLAELPEEEVKIYMATSRE